MAILGIQTALGMALPNSLFPSINTFPFPSSHLRSPYFHAWAVPYPKSSTVPTGSPGSLKKKIHWTASTWKAGLYFAESHLFFLLSSSQLIRTGKLRKQKNVKGGGNQGIQ